MGKIVFIWIATFWFNQGFAQNLTKQHVYPTNSKIALVPPANFQEAGSFVGFQQASTNASIMINELPVDISLIKPKMTASAFAPKGVMVSKINEIKHFGIDVKEIIATQSIGDMKFNKVVWVFGNENSCFLVNGVWPIKNEKLGVEVYNAMKTIVWKMDVEIDPVANSKFDLDYESVGFSYDFFMSGMYSFKSNLNDINLNKKANFFVAEAIQTVTVVDKVNYAKNRFLEMPQADEYEIEKVVETEVDGKKAVELWAHKTGLDTTEMMYQLIIYNADSYYICSGITNFNSEKFALDFSTIGHSFKLKK